MRAHAWVMRVVGAAAGVLAAAGAAAGTGSYGYGGPRLAKEQWPTAVALRSPTLASGMVELALPVAVDLAPGAHGEPVNLPLGLHLGATDWLTLGVAHARGLCVSGGGGCARAYDDVRVDALARLFAAGPFTGTYGVALAAGPLHGATALSGEARLGLRFSSAWYALELAAIYGFGFTQRDLDRVDPVIFPLAGTLGFGTFDTVPNRETVALPVTAIVQAGTHVALSAGVAPSGVLDPVSGTFGDSYRVPAGMAAVITPTAAVDLGAGLTFPNLWGRRDPVRPRSDDRVLEVFVAIRPGAGSRRAAPPTRPAVYPTAEAAPAPPAVIPVPAPAAEPSPSVAAIPAVAGTTAKETPPAPAYTIAIEGFAFVPASLAVPPGATITVQNRDAAPHTVTSQEAPDRFEPGGAANVSFDTGVFASGERTIVIPADAPPGTVVPYYCAVHKGVMKAPNGEIRIVAP